MKVKITKTAIVICLSVFFTSFPSLKTEKNVLAAEHLTFEANQDDPEPDEIINIHYTVSPLIERRVDFRLKVPFHWDIVEVSWEFGDGESGQSESEFISHTYDFEGRFNVMCTVSVQREVGWRVISKAFNASRNITIKATASQR